MGGTISLTDLKIPSPFVGDMIPSPFTGPSLIYNYTHSLFIYVVFIVPTNILQSLIVIIIKHFTFANVVLDALFYSFEDNSHIIVGWLVLLSPQNDELHLIIGLLGLRQEVIVVHISVVLGSTIFLYLIFTVFFFLIINLISLLPIF